MWRQFRLSVTWWQHSKNAMKAPDWLKADEQQYVMAALYYIEKMLLLFYKLLKTILNTMQ